MLQATHKLIIIAAPSGAGKTSIVRHLLQTFPDQLGFSVSCATRVPRKNEKDGVDYYFISEEEFKKQIEKDAFAEWEMVYEGKYYGTPRSELERIWQQGQAPLLDVDVKGGLNVKKYYPNSLAIFVEPPSMEILKERLEGRGTETLTSLQDRLSKASFEMRFRNEFDKIVINDSLERACREVEGWIRSYLSL
ncbi:MAG: guanylate kinase [Chitinophagaceae bacterium]|jgi:guanylate kinase